MHFKSRMLVLISLAVLLILAACSQQGEKNTAPEQTESSNTAPTPEQTESNTAAGKYDPAIEVTSAFFEPTGFKIEPGKTIEDNIWTQSLSDEFGIKMKYIWSVPLSQAQQKMNIAIASNDLPDIIPVYDLIQFKQLVDSGVARDITDLLNTDLDPFAREQIFGDGGEAMEQLKVDGKIMGIAAPKVQLGDTSLLWIRADWLKNLNLQAPKTMNDVLKISELFTNNDPDQNGINDTFGIGLDKGLDGVKGFFESYHAYPFNGFWVKSASGNKEYGEIQPEIKPALAQLAKMFKNGEIDPEFAVKDSQKANELIVSGKVGMFFGPQFVPFSPLQQSKEQDPNADWKPYPIVSIDDQPAKPATTPGVNTWIYVINKNMKHPEAAIKIVNYMMKKDNIFSEDYDVRYHKTADGLYQTWHLMPMRISASPTTHHAIYENVAKYLETKDMSFLAIEDIKSNAMDAEAYLKGDIKKWGQYTWSGPEGAWSVIVNDYRNKKNYQTNEYYKTPTETMVAKGPTLEKMKDETFTKIIMNKESIDAFDKFVDNWKKLGGEQITAEVNESK